MKNRRVGVKESALILIVAFLFSQLVVLFGQMIISAILAMLDYSESKINNYFNTATGYFFISALQFISFVIVYLYCHKNYNLKSTNFGVKLNVKHSLLYILIGIVTMFSLTNLINYYCLRLSLFDYPIASYSYSIDSLPKYLISIVSLAIFPAIGEELIFRGIIFNGLKQKGYLFAVILSSFMFTLIHFSLTQLVYPFLFGMILALAFVKSKNIILPILIHFTNNFLNITFSYFNLFNSFKPNTLNLILMFVGIVVYLLVVAFLFVSCNKQEKTGINNLEEGNLKEFNKAEQKTNKIIKNDWLIFSIIMVFMVGLYIIII